jgi:anhydro-N-acetylmuramic acid kinase
MPYCEEKGVIMYGIGLMSGTSLDGIDAALVKIEGSGLNTKVNLIAFETYGLPKEIVAEIKEVCMDETPTTSLICSLNFKLGKLFSETVKKICEKAQIPTKDIDFVASHGQTIYHIPRQVGTNISSTLQIGEPSIIAYDHNVTVISNFRTMDMAAGGEGAPLVPYSEFILYGGRRENIALQNIGGIGNVTIIPGTGKLEEVRAFDTGPGNMMIDEACHFFFGSSYDKNGDIAKRGDISKELFEELISHPFIDCKPPKTTGREVFGAHYVKELINRYPAVKPEDFIATFTAFTAYSVIRNYKQFILSEMKLNQVIISGGGAHNRTLVSWIKAGLKDEVDVITQEEAGHSSDAKEAIAFAILGNETLNGKSSNVPSATGANESVILGNITLSPRNS